MSYSYVGAHLLPKGIGVKWQEVDIGQSTVSSLFNSYQRIILTVTIEEETLYVDLEQLRTEYQTYSNTVLVLLQSIGNRTLDRLSTLPWGEKHSIVYMDAVRGGYSYKLCKAGYVYPTDYPKDELMDLELYRAKYPTDLSLIHSYCLVSVNGMYHMTDTDGDKAFIIEGGRSIRHQNVGHVGITSFYDVGALTKIKLKEEQIYPPVQGNPLKETVGFSLTESTEGKSFFMVLGGYLVFPEEGVFWKAGENDYRINFQRLPYLERILESQNFLSLADLKLTETSINSTNVNVDEVWTDEVLKRYLLLSQSFFVIVDSENLFWNKITLRQALMPGTFTAYFDPTYPFVVGYGRTVEYWKVFEDTQWSLNVVDSWYRRYIFTRSEEKELVNVTSQLSMDRPFFYSQGTLLEVGCYKEVSV